MGNTAEDRAAQRDDSATAIPLRHIPQLDGVRGLAILFVVFYHAGSILRDSPLGRFTEFGWAGVDLFFVLSGFLITGILLKTRNAPGYYRRFYIKRGLRIWPLYLLYLALMGTLNAVQRHFQPGIAGSLVSPWPLYLLFFQNLFWPSLFSARDYLAITWSLCIEEHFYLLWAPSVKRLGTQWLKPVLIGILIVSPLLRMAIFALLRGGSYSDFYQTVTRFTPLHLDAISAGCVLALVWSKSGGVTAYCRMFAALFAFGLIATVVTCLTSNGYLFSWCFSALAITFSGLVGLVLTGWLSAFFSLPALRYVGKVSYGLYLIHPTIFEVFQSHTIFCKLGLMNYLPATEFIAVILATAISIGVAGLSWRFFENPILAHKASLAK